VITHFERDKTKQWGRRLSGFDRRHRFDQRFAASTRNQSRRSYLLGYMGHQRRLPSSRTNPSRRSSTLATVTAMLHSLFRLPGSTIGFLDKTRNINLLLKPIQWSFLLPKIRRYNPSIRFVHVVHVIFTKHDGHGPRGSTWVPIPVPTNGSNSPTMRAIFRCHPTDLMNLKTGRNLRTYDPE
jgi:hypothetical protein